MGLLEDLQKAYLQPTVNYLALGFDLEDNIRKMNTEAKKLEGKKLDKEIEVCSEMSYRSGLKCSEQFTVWLTLAERAITEAAKIDRDYQTVRCRCGCICDYPLNVFVRHWLSRRAFKQHDFVVQHGESLPSSREEIFGKLFQPEDEGGQRPYLDPSTSSDLESTAKESVAVACKAVGALVVEKMMPPPQAAEGGSVDVMLEQLWSLLREGSGVGLVGVHGMAGVGKSHLLTALCNKLSVETQGFQVMKIQVNGRMDVEKIQSEIGLNMKLIWQRNQTKDRANQICHVLTHDKKYIILFDDVWEKLPLNSIGIPDPKRYPQCCKVVIATRVLDVCSEAQKIIRVNCLPMEESWNLFREKVGEKLTGSDSEIESSAKQIAEKCGGLPLALSAIGQAMSSIRSTSEWKDAVVTMENEPWKIPDVEHKVLNRLRQSYDNLKSDMLRSCFTYFYLYPKDSPPKWSWLTDYWIGEGFVEYLDDMDMAHGKRDDIIGTLEGECLLYNSSLHNMFHAMASWIGSGYGVKKNMHWLVLPGVGLTEAPEADKWRDAQRVSLMFNKISTWPDGPACHGLISLLLWKSVWNRKFDNGFFKFMPSLKVLDLSASYLEELPPSIGELHELQFLDVSNSNLESLPKELGNLCKLRFLSLERNFYLRTIPDGVFERFSKMQVLRMYKSHGDWRGGVQFEELTKLKQVKQLDITIGNMTGLQILANCSHLSASTRSLDMTGFTGAKSILLPRDLGENMKTLGWLRITDSAELEEIAFDGSGCEGSIVNLHNVELEKLYRAKIIWKGLGPRGCLGNLCDLSITKCDMIEELVGDVQEEEEGPFAFPNLKVLYLIDLPALKHICRSPLMFPSLKKLWVDKCPKVKKLPFAAYSGRNLEVIWGSKRWWNELEWEGEVIKSTFERYYKEW